MSLAEIHTLLAYNRELIADTWNFFVTVQLALLGLIFIADRQRVLFSIRALMIPAYAGFMYINYRAQVDNYSYTTKVLEYAGIIESGQSEPNAALSVIFETGWITRYLELIYVMSFGFGVVAILLGALSGPLRLGKQDRKLDAEA